MRRYNIQSRNMKPEFPRLCEFAYRNPINKNTKNPLYPNHPQSRPKKKEKKYNTQASPHRKQTLPRDAGGQIREILGAVVDAALVPEPEDHARLVGGRVGVGRGDEVFDGGAHVVC